MSHPSNPTHHTCHTCGHVWEHGKHGGHDCSVLLLKKIEELDRKLSPRLWNKAEHRAWHGNIPHIQRAFDELKAATSTQ